MTHQTAHSDSVEQVLSRREWICRACALGVASLGSASVLAACGAESATSPDEPQPQSDPRPEPPAGAPPIAFIEGTDVVIELARTTALDAVGGSLILPSFNVAVLRLENTEFRAFSNICTHSGCGIFDFSGSRFRCQCHGSEFDITGRNVAGPAPSPLPRYETRYEAGARRLRVVRG